MQVAHAIEMDISIVTYVPWSSFRSFHISQTQSARYPSILAACLSLILPWRSHDTQHSPKKESRLA